VSVVRLASFNVENLFARAKVLNTTTWEEGRPQLAAFERFNRTAQRRFYRKADKRQMLRDLETLKVITRASSDGRLIRQPNTAAQLAILRENRGDFMVERRTTGIEIVATGRGDWIGWLELVVESVDEAAIRMTARVIQDLAAGVLAVVEAENRPSLVRFNETMLANRYRHVMLVDGNDERGIDVGLLTTARRPIVNVESHVDDRDTRNPDVTRRDDRLFSRDAPVYTVRCEGEDLLVVVNHLKSQSPTGDEPPDQLRRRQSTRLASIYRTLRRDGARFVAMVGDFNRGPDEEGRQPSLEALFRPALGLVDVYDLAQFDTGPRPGTFQSCGLRERLDYIFLSPELAARVTRGGIFRRGLWGRPTNKNPPSDWEIYDDITESIHAASDHAAVWVDLDFP
jgi:endonuclease/exonuclease/phosphatase family metal-dependent hydrolase